MKQCLLLAATLILSTHSVAALNCNSTIKNQSIHEDIKAGKNCSLENLIIRGNISIEKNARVELKNNHIQGNLYSDNFFSEVKASDNIIQGNIQFQSGKNIQLENNQVKGSIHLIQNKGNISLASNHIAGDLICSKNSFNMQVVRNKVEGAQREQCQNLR